MSTNPRSATAYEQLRRLSGKQAMAEQLSHSWLKVNRALIALEQDLSLAGQLTDSYRSLLQMMRENVLFERDLQNDASRRLSNEMDTLNAQIQNGVFDE